MLSGYVSGWQYIFYIAGNIADWQKKRWDDLFLINFSVIPVFLLLPLSYRFFCAIFLKCKNFYPSVFFYNKQIFVTYNQVKSISSFCQWLIKNYLSNLIGRIGNNEPGDLHHTYIHTGIRKIRKIAY